MEDHQRRHLPPLQLASASLSSLAASSRAGLAAPGVQSGSLEANHGALRHPAVCSSVSGPAGSNGGSSRRSSGRPGSRSSSAGGSGAGARFNFFSRAIRLGAGGGAGAAAFVSWFPQCRVHVHLAPLPHCCLLAARTACTCCVAATTCAPLAQPCSLAAAAWRMRRRCGRCGPRQARPSGERTTARRGC